MMSYSPSEATLANTTRLPVSDAVKFNMADRVHRLSLAASKVLEVRHIDIIIYSIFSIITTKNLANQISPPDVRG